MARSDYLRARPSGLEERQGNDPAGRFPAPDLEGQRGARGRELGGNVREGDPLAERRGKAAARRLGHRFPVGTDRRPVARDRSGLGDLDPDEPALRAFGRSFERTGPPTKVWSKSTNRSWPASSGVWSRWNSWPERRYPFSRRRVSRQPRPHGTTPAASNRSARASASPAGTNTS